MSLAIVVPFHPDADPAAVAKLAGDLEDWQRGPALHYGAQTPVVVDRRDDDVALRPLDPLHRRLMAAVQAQEAALDVALEALRAYRSALRSGEPETPALAALADAALGGPPA